MARLIPNESTWVGFVTTANDIANISAPTASEIAAAVPLSGFVVSLNASSQGNTLPTPSFDTLFETTVSGTISAQFTADFYRDDAADTAWTSLPRQTTGFFVISRFGGSGTGNLPVAADEVEVWPVTVTSRTMQNMASNQVQKFQLTCSIPSEPDEEAIVAA